jgi:hypothetical protein
MAGDARQQITESDETRAANPGFFVFMPVRRQGEWPFRTEPVVMTFFHTLPLLFSGIHRTAIDS